jgi:branched-chain amino acid transport system substrate-binding protein
MKNLAKVLGKVLFVLAILALGTEPAEAGEVVKIGVLLPFTGPLAFEGDQAFRGFEVARVEQNEKGGLFGKQIEFVKGDAIDAKAAVSEAERLITLEGVKVIVGTFSSVLAIAASTVAEKSRVIYWEVGAVSDVITARGYKYLFRTNHSSAIQARSGFSFCIAGSAKTLGIPLNQLKVAIVGEQSSYGQSVSENAKKMVNELGATVVAYEFYDANTNDLSSLIMRLKARNPDILIPTSYINDAILLHRQMRQLDLNVKVFLGTGSGHNTPKIRDALGGDINGVMVMGFPGPRINPDYAKGFPNFLNLYEKVWKSRDVTTQPFANYSGVWVLWRALERAGSLDPEAIRKSALAMDEPEGYMPLGWGAKFAGPDHPNAGQNLRTSAFVEQWQDGSLYTVFPEKAMAKGRKIILPFPRWSERK